MWETRKMPSLGQLREKHIIVIIPTDYYQTFISTAMKKRINFPWAIRVRVPIRVRVRVRVRC